MLRALCLIVVGLLAIPLHAEDLGSDSWDIRLTGTGSGVQKTAEGIALLYRPHLVSKKKWYHDTSVSLEVKPPEAVKADDGRTYGDSLCIVIRSSLRFRTERSYETLDGLVARIDFVTGDLYLQTTKDGVTFTNLATTKGEGPLSHEEWHQISLKDFGENVTLTVGKKSVSASVEKTGPGYAESWAIYNREPVGPGAKITQLRKVTYVTPPR